MEASEESIYLLEVGDLVNKVRKFDQHLNSKWARETSFDRMMVLDTNLVLYANDSVSEKTRIALLDPKGVVYSSIEIGNSRNAIIVNDSTSIFLIDNAEYEGGFNFIRLNKLDRELNLDSSVYVARDEAQILSNASLLGERLILVGEKEEVGGVSLIELMFTTRFEKMFAKSSVLQSSLSDKREAVLFESGCVVAYQEEDTLRLLIRSNDGTVVHSSYLDVENSVLKGLTYYQETNSLLIQLVSEGKSILVKMSLNGTIESTYVFEEQLINIEVVDEFVVALERNESELIISKIDFTQVGNCTLGEMNLNRINFSTVTNNYNPTLIENTEIVTKTNPVLKSITGINWETSCPLVSIVNPEDTVFCIGDTVEITGVGDEQYVWINSENDTISSGETATIVIQEKNVFTLKGLNGAIYELNITASYEGECSTELIVYDFISANSDTQNEVLFLENIEFHKPCRVAIFNKDNQKVFETFDYNNTWDGENNPAGEYFYYISTQGVEIQGKLLLKR